MPKIEHKHMILNNIYGYLLEVILGNLEGNIFQVIDL